MGEGSVGIGALRGYDTRHAAHLLRLYRMGSEILRRELAEAAASRALPAEPDVAAVAALVVDLQRWALEDVRRQELPWREIAYQCPIELERTVRASGKAVCQRFRLAARVRRAILCCDGHYDSRTRRTPYPPDRR